MELEKLIECAIDAQKNSYSPYSKFAVGACLLAKSGKIYCGANIENASYPVGICAERVATSKAICDGEKEFDTIVITCDDKNTYPYPCGMCRQFLSEFGTDLNVVVAKSKTDFKLFKLKELLPCDFKK